MMYRNGLFLLIFSIATDIRHSASFTLIILSFWDQDIPMYIAEVYHSIFNDDGSHIHDLWESEIYDAMEASQNEDYNIVKEQLIEFYKKSYDKDKLN